MTAANIIDGKAFAERLRTRIAAVAADFEARAGRKAGLAVVLVGEDPASQVYVRNKGRQTLAAGMESFEHKLPADTSEADLLALRYTTYRVLADELSGKAPGPEVSVIKVRGGEIMQTLTELLMEMAEAEGLVHPLTLPHDGLPVVPFELEHMAQQFFDRRKLTIYGGSSEIQRNIISKMILGL